MNKAGKFLYKTVVLHQWESLTQKFSIINKLNHNKLATIKSFKADVSSIGPLSEPMAVMTVKLDKR